MTDPDRDKALAELHGSAECFWCTQGMPCTRRDWVGRVLDAGIALGKPQGRREGLEHYFTRGSLCVECGPGVEIDDDGCCAGCGATATGYWLRTMQDALAEQDQEPGQDGGGRDTGEGADRG